MFTYESVYLEKCVCQQRLMCVKKKTKRETYQEINIYNTLICFMNIQKIDIEIFYKYAKKG